MHDAPSAEETDMMNFRSASTALALPIVLTFAASFAHGQQDAAPSAAQGNKAAKPPVEAAAQESGAATRKPAKPGAQAGPATPEADAADAAKGNKAGKPSVDEAASRSGIATKKPAKPGVQSGPAASAP
jgi:hypothetical protein